MRAEAGPGIVRPVQHDPRSPDFGESRIDGAIAPQSDSRREEGNDSRVEGVIAGLAARQHGRVARWQLLPAGVSVDAIRHRLETGRLHLLHRGVYAVGHVAPTPYGREMAAVLAAGPGAVLGHRSAAVLWGLLPPRPGPVDVVRHGAKRDSRPGITIHRTNDLPRADLTHRHGIPVTTPTRTLIDLAPTPELDRALNEALIRRLIDTATLLTRAVDRRGARRLRELLQDGPTPTRSEAERRLLALIKAAGLPRPQTNVRLGGHEVDALWRDQRLVVEVDGYAFHSSRAAFEDDRHRDAELMAAGYRVLRFTWRQLTRHPEVVVARLAAALAG